jgi:dTDP-4-dehydrorhamnose reductase
MRIMIIGDTPLTRRVAHIYESYFMNEHAALIEDPSLEDFDTFRPNMVLNGKFSETDDPRAFADNAKHPAVFALFARMVGSDYFHMSDSSVFSTDYPADTDDPYPTRIYGLSRLIGERAIRTLHPNAVIVRTSWLYGPEYDGCMPMLAWEVENGDRSQAHVYDDVKLSPTYVGDAAAVVAVNMLTATLLNEPGGTYHLAPYEQVTWYDYLKEDYPFIKPLKARHMVNGRKVQRNVSVRPSAGWSVEPGGLARFQDELDTGSWDWMAGFGNPAEGS